MNPVEHPRPAPPATDADQAALRRAALGEAALCTIVGIDGSFSRRIGAQLAVGWDGTIAGSLADGCLEAELASQAAQARDAGEHRLLRYGRGSPVIDFRLPCGSGLDIVIDPCPDRNALEAAVALLDRREPASLALPVPGCSHRHYLPALRLVLCGTGPEADELAALARAFGAAITVLRPDDGLALGQPPEGAVLDAWTALVVLFHDHEWEGALLDWALRSPAFYIGAQGGAEARATRRSRLRALGHDDTALARIRSPIGLIPHSRDARVLALSILAEAVACYEALRT